MSVFGQLASSLLIQGIKVASVATARLSGHEQPDDDEELPQKAEEPTPAQPVPCTTPFEQQNGAPDSPDVAVSIAGDDSLGSETTSDRSRLADVAKDVVLRIECYDNKRWSYGALAITWFAQIAAVVAAFAIAFEVGFQTSSVPPQKWFENKRFAKINCAAAAALLAGIMAMLGIMALRAIALLRQQKQWTQRRWRLASIHSVLLLVQVPNAALYLGVNVWTLTGTCRFYGPLIDWFSFVSWSTLGSTLALLLVLAHCAWPLQSKASRFAIVLDRPWTVHWPILLLWVPFEVLAAVDSFRFPSGERFPAEWIRPGPVCYVASKCPVQRAYWGLYMTLGILLFVFGVTWMVLVVRALTKLRRSAYHRFKLANMMIRFQTRIVISAMLTFVLNSFVLQLTRPLNCISYLLVAFGRLPNQVVVVAMVFMLTFFHMPKLDQPIITDFAWAEDDIARRCAERAEHADLPTREPMFCMETALKLLFWSFLVYREESEEPAPGEPVADELKVEDRETQEVHGEEGETGIEATLGRGLAMYDLKEAQIHSETETDTHCLLAWSCDTILLAFRGTATKVNVLADLKAWPVPHPPKRGNPWLQTRPRVHAGFLKSWRANGLNERVLEHIRDLVEEQHMDIGSLKVYITGHSLGGALAILAAYDIQQAFGFRHLRVYTFGAPRVGNHRFAREYNDTVPNTWTVINDKDIVPTVPKWKVRWFFIRFSLFKRSGLRVHLSEEELMVVRPSLMESRLGLVFSVGGSVKQHLLASYIEAFVRVCTSQMKRDTRTRGGRHGVKALLDKPPLHTMLLQAGLDINVLGKQPNQVHAEDSRDAREGQTKPEQHCRAKVKVGN